MVDAINRIHALDDHVINQIAAGEVVERPLSVVKELTENALDAGAGRIEVTIEKGGLAHILVSDNGAGIAVDDLSRAVMRHCTSKLKQASELFALTTLGFRGEALASIAAVSRLTLISRVPNAQHAWGLDCEFGAINSPKPTSAFPPGTRVEVRNLFENTPARRKFQKQARTEYLAILNFLKQLAFCHPAVEFVFNVDDKQVFRAVPVVDANSLQRRAQSLFGKDFAQNSVSICWEQGTLRIEGLAGAENYHRPRADLQYLTLNQRVIKDKSIMHAVRLAYDGKIPEGRYPAFALDIRMSPEEVDVNVHPSKSEVKFSEPRRVHDQIYSHLRRAISSDGFLPGAPQFEEALSTVDRPVAYQNVAKTPGSQAQIAEKRYAKRYTDKVSVPLPLIGSEHGTYAGALGKDFALLMADGEAIIIQLNEIVSTLLSKRLSTDTRSRPLIVPQSVPGPLLEYYQKAKDELDGCGVIIEMLGPDNLVLREVPVVLPPLDYAEFLSQLVNTKKDPISTRVATAASRSMSVPRDFKAQQRWFNQLIEQAASVGVEWREFAVEKTIEQWQKFLHN